MRAMISKQAGWAGLCAMLISGCASQPPPPPPTPPPALEAFPAPPDVVPPAKPKPPPDADSGPASATPVNSGNVDEGTDAGSSFDNLDIVDAGLNGKLAVLRVGSETGANNLLSVFAGLKNKTAHRLALEVETIYKDQAGNPLNAGSWIVVMLKPHEETEYRSSSISEDAVDFLIRVRHAKNAAGSAHG